MEVISVFKLKDGTMIECGRDAVNYCENKFGEELDGLLKDCPRLGAMAKMEVMRAIIAKPKEFLEMAGWVKEYYKVKEEI